MARTSKTKIGDSGESNDRMMRAASSGAAAVQQAHSELMNQYRSGADQANQTAQVAGQVVGQGEERNQRQAQFEDQIELDAAKSGFERNTAAPAALEGQEPASAQSGPGKASATTEEQPNERSKSLDQEMAKGQGQGHIGPLDPESQQRLNETSKQKLEMDGQGRWRPTQERKDAQARTQQREDFQADTDRMSVIERRDQIGATAQRAFIADDMKTYDENSKTEAGFANSRQQQYDKFNKGDATDNDWSEMAEIAKTSEQFDPTLMAAIKAKDMNSPRVREFLRAQVAKDSLQAIARTGATKFLDVDWTNPRLVEFGQQRESIALYYAVNPSMVPSFVNSSRRKMYYINQQAAVQVMIGMAQAPRGQASGGMMPATAPEGASPSASGPGGGAPFNEAQSGVGQIMRQGLPQQQRQPSPQGTGQFPGGVGR